MKARQLASLRCLPYVGVIYMVLRRLRRTVGIGIVLVLMLVSPVGAEPGGQDLTSPSEPNATDVTPASLGQCIDKVGYICGWTSTSWRGGFHWWCDSVRDTGPGIRSIWNRDNYPILIYPQPGWQGSSRWVEAGEQVASTPWPVRSITAIC